MASTGRLSSEPLASADRPQQSGRIVVGVDASQGSLSALLWAFGEAQARKIPVHAVLAWQYHPGWADPGLGRMFPLGYRPGVGVPPDEFTDAAASVKNLLGRHKQGHRIRPGQRHGSGPNHAGDGGRSRRPSAARERQRMRHVGGRLSRTRRIHRGDARLRQPPRRVPLAVPRGGRPRPAASGERLEQP